MVYGMRMALVMVLVAAGAAAASARANDGFLYAGASVGRNEADNFCGGLGSCDDADTGWKLYGGYQLTPAFAFEAGYVWLGSFSAGSAGSDLEADVSGFFLSILGVWPINEDFSLHTSLAAAHTTADLSGALADGTERGTNFAIGFGGAYRLTWDLDLRLEWQRFNRVGGTNLDVSMWSAGLVYSW